MLIKIYPENPNPIKIKEIINCLNAGGIIIYPTDTIYGIGCNIHHPRAVEKISQIKGIKPEKANFSLICYDLSHLSDFCKQVDTPIYKLMKRALPGPFTFILEANNNVPKIFRRKKRTIGVRVPNNSIAREIVRELGNPIMNTSIHDEDEIIEYTTDPELIYEKYKNQVDLVIDGGYGKNVASTIIDCTQTPPLIIRQGIGVLEI